MGSYLDDAGTVRLWSKIKSKFVQKTGDTVTGSLTFSDSSGLNSPVIINRSGVDVTKPNEIQTNQGNSNVCWPYNVRDKNAKNIGYMGVGAQKDGKNRIYMTSASSSGATNYLGTEIDQDGNCTYMVSDPSKFRDAIGINSAITNITRSGTTFTATRANGSTFTFNQQDNNTTYAAGRGISLSGTTFHNLHYYSLNSSNNPLELTLIGFGYMSGGSTDLRFTIPLPYRIANTNVDPFNIGISFYNTYIRCGGYYLLGGSAQVGLQTHRVRDTVVTSTAVDTDVGTITDLKIVGQLVLLRITASVPQSGAGNNVPISIIGTFQFFAE